MLLSFIKENKRINIEQKALKEKFMNSEGIGGFGDSLNLMDMWRKPESMDSLLAEMSENSGSQNLEGYPDVGNLDPKVLITTVRNEHMKHFHQPIFLSFFS